MSRRERSLVVAVFFVSVALIASGIGMLMLWSTVKSNRGDINELEGQVRALGAIPITKQPPTPAETPTTTITTAPRPVPFPPTTVGPPANPPAAAAQAPSPAPEPTTTTTTAPPPTTTTPPTTATPCTTIPVLGTCITTRASRSGTRADALDWEALRQCESGGDYATNTGNGYFGAYQFSPETWQALGFDGLPSDAAPDVQDAAALLLYSQSGAQPWPNCGRRLTT